MLAMYSFASLNRCPRSLWSRTLWILGVLLWAGIGATAQPIALGQMRVELDDHPVEIGPLVADGDAVLVSVSTAAAALSFGRLALEEAHDGKSCALRARGLKEPLVRITGLDGGPSVAHFGNQTLPLTDGPRKGPLPGQPTPVVLMDLKTLAGVLGVTCDQDGARIALYSPTYWAERLGVAAKARESRPVDNLGLQPEMGISPPGRSVVVWVRPSTKTQIQIYSAADRETPHPLFGTNPFGEPVLNPHPPVDTVQARTAERGGLIRAETLFYAPQASPTPRYGRYIALLFRRETADPIDAINRGTLKPTDWSVVGLQQRIAPTIARYEPYRPAPGESLAAIAQKFQMPLALLNNINGLRADAELPRGDSVLVLADLEGDTPLSTSFVATGYYEVKPGDSLARIAQRCGVTIADLLLANPSLPLGAELMAGDVIRLIRRVRNSAPTPPPVAQRPPPPPKPDVRTRYGTVRADRDLGIRQYSGAKSPILVQVPKGTALSVLLVTDDSGSFQVCGPKDVVGWVWAREVVWESPAAANPGPPVPPPPPSGGDPGPVVREALRWVGVPRYQMGGTSLNTAIDCSHFVSAVFARAGQAVPDPPVHNQEIHGVLVHWRRGDAEEGGQVRTFPQDLSFASLRPGDRVIFQGQPKNFNSQGNHHTGIYLGRIVLADGQRLEHAVIHCNASRNTVSIDELTGRLWRIYRYSVRGTQIRH
jgi:LysM repeat protein